MKGVGHMQMVNKRLTAILMAACLLVALTFGVSAAVAEPITWPPSGNVNTLTVMPSGDSDIQADLADTKITVNVYQIATAKPNSGDQAFTYEYVAGFGEGELAAPKYGDQSAPEFWQGVADDAATKVEGIEPTGVGTIGGEGGVPAVIDSLPDGIYLVLVQGAEADEDNPYAVATNNFKYTFKPTAIALPTKEAVDGVISSANAGDWDNELTINLKPERDPQYGTIEINKSAPLTSAEPATFVFYLTGTTPEGKEYKNYASIYYPAQNSTRVTHIPVGTELTITEVYEGARFDGDGSVLTRTINSAETVETVSFTNTANTSQTGGHGIENHFVLSKDDGGAYWQPSRTPAQS